MSSIRDSNDSSSRGNTRQFRVCEEAEVDPDLICHVCKGVWDDPVELKPCGHIFCHHCLMSSSSLAEGPKVHGRVNSAAAAAVVGSSGGSTSNSGLIISVPHACPKCGKKVQKGKKPNRVLVNACLKVEVSCLKCGAWRGSREEAAHHFCSAASLSVPSKKEGGGGGEVKHTGSGHISRRSSAVDAAETSLGARPKTASSPKRATKMNRTTKKIGGGGGGGSVDLCNGGDSGSSNTSTSSFLVPDTGASNGNDSFESPVTGATAAPAVTLTPPPPRAAAGAVAATRTTTAALPTRIRRLRDSGSGGGGGGGLKDPVIALRRVEDSEANLLRSYKPIENEGIIFVHPGAHSPSSQSWHSLGPGTAGDPLPLTSDDDATAAAPRLSMLPAIGRMRSDDTASSTSALARRHSSLMNRDTGSSSSPHGSMSSLSPVQPREGVESPLVEGPWTQYGLLQKDYDQIMGIFLMFDETGSGRLTESMVQRLLLHMNYAQSRQDARALFIHMDRNHVGFVTLHEYCMWVRDSRPDPQALFGMSLFQYNDTILRFRTVDVDEKAVVDLPGFLQLCEINGFCSQSQLSGAEQLFRSYDVTNTGTITLHQFLTMVRDVFVFRDGHQTKEKSSMASTVALPKLGISSIAPSVSFSSISDSKPQVARGTGGGRTTGGVPPSVRGGRSTVAPSVPKPPPAFLAPPDPQLQLMQQQEQQRQLLRQQQQQQVAQQQSGRRPQSYYPDATRSTSEDTVYHSTPTNAIPSVDSQIGEWGKSEADECAMM